VLSHGAAVAGRVDAMPAITACVALVVATSLLVAARSARVRLAWLAVALATLIAWRFAPLLLLFAPPAVLSIAFGIFFATTLRAGREPRIATFARLERGEALPPDLAVYTRRLTWIWTIFLFASAAIGLALAATAPIGTWSAFVNVGSYVAMGGLFVGEYLYRRVRYRQHRHGSLLGLIRIVANDRRALLREHPAP
jgi:uncharacterized membrane protein